MPTHHSADITVMINAVRKAARGIVRDFGEVSELQVSRKGTLDFVTQTDLNAEKILHAELSRARPKFGFLMEEGGEIAGEDPKYRWVIDPLDGTTNFIHAVPYFCISVALEEKRAGNYWAPIAAVIYEPLHDELFHAEENNGAFCNDRRMQISSRTSLDEALLVTHSPKHDRDNFRHSLELMTAVTEQSKGARTMGATALDLAYLAAGKFDAGWYTAFKRWDIAAGVLLAKEAGATVTQLDGDESIANAASFLIGTPKIHASLLRLLKPVWKQRGK